jgi:succinate dehydrogenase / fumarate reductase membrane anchor subunit
MKEQNTQTPLGRAIGLGSARSGAEHWWTERLTAVALLPLAFWFVGAIVAHTGSDFPTAIAWLRSPLTMILMILLLAFLFWHTALGLQVVAEDYIHSRLKFPIIIMIRLCCFVLAISGTVAVLEIAFAN